MLCFHQHKVDVYDVANLFEHRDTTLKVTATAHKISHSSTSSVVPLGIVAVIL